MSIYTIFRNDDINLFFDDDDKKLMFEKNDTYYEINTSTFQRDDMNLRQKIDSIYNLINAIQVSGKVGPRGLEGKKGKQGEKGPKGPKGDIGERGEKGDASFIYIRYFGNSVDELPIPKNVEEVSYGLIKDTFDLYIYFESKWQRYGNLMIKGDKGDKGDIGERGCQGIKGEKGEKGNPFLINHFFKTDDDLKESNKLFLNGEYILVENSGNFYKFDDFKLKFITSLKGPKGDKGKKGDGLKIDLIIEDAKILDIINENPYDDCITFFDSCDSDSSVLKYFNDLSNNDLSNNDLSNNDVLVSKAQLEFENLINKIKQSDMILEKNTLDIYFKNDNIYELAGNIKGVKGDKGDRGKVGERGPVGKGLRIDHYFDNYNNYESSSINFKYGNVIFLKDRSNLYFWDNGLHSIGRLNNIIYKNVSTDLKLYPVCESHQNISIDRLFEIKHNLVKGYYKEKHLIKILICWECVNNKISVDFFKKGILFFAEENNNLIKNSTKFDTGYPYVNTLTHNFIMSDFHIENLRFFIKLNYKEGMLNIVNDCNMFEITEI